MHTVEEELVEILEQRVELLFDPLKEAVNSKDKHHHYKATTNQFRKSYAKVFDQAEAMNYTIHSFAQVGIHDPYQHENTEETFVIP
jgi:hypothetical protein